jgi:hypothetical protein
MRSVIAAVLGGLVLAGCGGGGAQLAAKACEKQVQEKLAGRSYELDVNDLAKNGTSEGSDMVRLTSTIVFDRGLSSEYKQIVDCKVRIEKDKEPVVIFLQFNWSMDDVKKT